MSQLRIPKLSIIMPVLNCEKTIEKALSSVINQRYDNLELIVLDGGSSDKTVEIIKHFEQYIAYWHSQYDGSPSVAVNFGIEKATGDHIALLMADDWYEPDTLKKVSEAILKHPDADMITCGGRIVSFDHSKQSHVTLQYFDTKKSLYLSFYNICFAASAICCRFIKKSFYNQIGSYILYDQEGRHIYSNDKEFLLRAVIYHAKDIFIHYLGHNYLSHSGSSTFSHNKNMDMRLCKEHMYIAEMYLAKNNLLRNQRLLLNYWYNDQSARLVLYHLLRRDFQSAAVIVKQGIKKYPFIWPILFAYTAAKILIKRVFRKLTGVNT